MNNLAAFLFIVVTPFVVVFGALATLFAIGALFNALENPDSYAATIRGIFRRPLRPPKPPAKDHYYRPYWTATPPPPAASSEQSTPRT
jgi:hypothetical protein